MATQTEPSASGLRRIAESVNWLGAGVVLVLIGVWQAVIAMGLLDFDSLPAPVDIWHALGELADPGGGLWEAVGHTVRIVLLAWLIGAGLGAVVGVIVSWNAVLASWSSATIDLLRSLPVVALIPIVILVWGNGDQAEIILGSYAAAWPMMINTVGGVRAVPTRLIESARTLGLSRWSTAVKIIVPSAGSAMLVGARLSLATALVVCVVAEMLGLQQGVGNQLVLMQSAMQPASMWVYVLTTGALGLLANASLIRAFRLLVPGVAAVAERSSR